MTGKKNTARADSQSASFIYYECSQYLNSGRRSCKSHYIKGEAIAKEITTHILSFAETVLSKAFTKNVIEPLKAELVIIRKQVLDTRAKASKAQDAFAENFENYMDGKISKEQFSENAISIRENMKRLEAEEREQRQVNTAPRQLGLAPLALTQYKAGEQITLTVVFDEVIHYTSNIGFNIPSSLPIKDVKFVGGKYTNALTFTATVTKDFEVTPTLNSTLVNKTKPVTGRVEDICGNY